MMPSGSRIFWTLLAWIPLLAWLGGYFPGILTYDSMDQWRQALGETPWVDVHPPAHTALVWVAAQLGSPAWLAAAGSFLLAWSIVGVAHAIASLGASEKAVAVAATAVVLSPSLGIFGTAIWKDVPYTAAVLLIGEVLIRLAAAQHSEVSEDLAGTLERSLPPRRLLLWLVVWSIVATLLRQNGLVVGGFALVAVAVLVPRLRWRAAGAAVLLPAVLLFARLVVYPAVGVQAPRASIPMAVLVHDVAATARHAPDAIPAEDWRVLEAVAPKAAWVQEYDCTSVHPLLNSGRFDFRAIDYYPRRFAAVWWRGVRARPSVFLGHRLCAAEIAWRPVERPGSWFFTITRGIELNRLGLESAPKLERAHGWMNAAVDRTELPALRPLFWRAPIWILAAWIGTAVALWRRRDVVLLLPMAGVVGVQLSVALANPGQDARYMAGAGVLSVLLVALGWVRRRPPRPLPQDAAPDEGEVVRAF